MVQRISAPEKSEDKARRLTAEVRSDKAKANTVPALKVELAKLAEVVEILLADRDK